MLDLDMAKGCDVLMLPDRGGPRSIATLRSDIALVDAIRFVAEDLGSEARERAVIRTARRNVFAAEAAGLYGLLGRYWRDGSASPTVSPAFARPVPERAANAAPAGVRRLSSAA